MKRRIKFRAYIPKLDIMVYKISLLCNGDIQVDEDYLNDKLVETGKRIFIKHDHDNEGNDCIMERISEDDYITLLPLVNIDYGQVQIHRTNSVINLNTGVEDSNGKEVYQGDIVEVSELVTTYRTPKTEKYLGTVDFSNERFQLRSYDNGWYKPYLLEIKDDDDNIKYKVIGNIYQDKHLFKKN